VPAHLEEENRRPLPSSFRIKAGWIFGAKPVHDHCLAHAAVAEDSDRRHTCRPRMADELVELIECMFRSRIEDPALGKNSSDAYLAWLGE
jgi:hypothetical protein